MKIYNVMAKSWGGLKRPVMCDISLDEAVEFCENHNWEWCPDGGYIWDLYIDDYEIEE